MPSNQRHIPDHAVRRLSGVSVERIPVHISEDPAELSRLVAGEVSDLIRERQSRGEKVVLGLPTGSTPIGVYQELVRMHHEEGLDFSNVITFNLDEYYPMQPDSIQSYHRFMLENFFDHVNVPKENIHIPDGRLEPDEIDEYCAEYERKIKEAGGIDLMMLGIGRSGHIGFNEPGSHPNDRTRLIVLDEITKKDAASDFFEEKYVPLEAITMGVGTILESRRIVLMATGEHKARIIKRAIEEPESSSVSATYLQRHPNAMVYLDRAVAGELTREKTPWLVRAVKWDVQMAKRAVIWLARREGKAIAELEVSDFHRNHMHDLVHAYGDTDDLCQSVLDDLHRKIYSRKQLPSNKRVIVFSPHPDDDVISMGGMLGKLVENENDVTVAYMTNGSVAVFDQDVRRHMRFFDLIRQDLYKSSNADGGPVKRVLDFIEEKQPAQVDTKEVQRIKAYIRYTEAVSAIELMGLTAEDARFLDLPFYKTGMVKKDPVGDADIQIILDLLNEKDADHVFVAGDLSDPHGTHRMCYSAISQALDRRAAGNSGRENPLVWLYRGAWQEWEIDRTDVFLPLSKADLDRKIEAVFKHESQKDRALFPGAYDQREFWQRAMERNRATAQSLDELGLPRFYAAEAFVTVQVMP